MSSSWSASFLDAFQATLSVSLVIFYGFLANQLKFLDGPSSKKISVICVRMFLPALIITTVGAELHTDTASRYIPILIWALFYNIFSICIGLLSVKLFKFPRWIIPTLAFNSTTSLPLLLIQSLELTGSLSHLLINGDSSSEAVARAKSYFLVNGVVSNCLIFSLGPRLMQGQPKSELPTRISEERRRDDEGFSNEFVAADQVPESEHDSEHVRLLTQAANFSETSSEEQIDKDTGKKINWFTSDKRAIYQFLADFFNEQFIAAIIGAFIGLIPPVQMLFFNKSDDGGIFTAWLTSSLKRIGELFVSLQVIVVGASLSASVQKMRRGEDSGKLPFRATSFVLLGRFVIWPIISISMIWTVVKMTGGLGGDPVLWFTMMLMPTGPPAMKLIAMADVGEVGETKKMSIAKLLTLSNFLSPVLALIVMASLSDPDQSNKLDVFFGDWDIKSTFNAIMLKFLQHLGDVDKCHFDYGNRQFNALGKLANRNSSRTPHL